jgi:hypothetical protein
MTSLLVTAAAGTPDVGIDWGMILAPAIAGAVGLVVGAFAAAWATSFRQDFVKRRELALHTTEEFYSAYGEFYATWKRWNYSFPKENPAVPPEPRELMLERVLRAEAKMEPILIKLLCEREMEPQEIEAAAKFRQAFQQLRAAIRHNHRLNWEDTRQPEYLALKRNASYVGYLISTMHIVRRPDPATLATQLTHAMDQRWEENWQEPVARPPRRVSGFATFFSHLWR